MVIAQARQDWWRRMTDRRIVRWAPGRSSRPRAVRAHQGVRALVVALAVEGCDKAPTSTGPSNASQSTLLDSIEVRARSIALETGPTGIAEVRTGVRLTNRSASRREIAFAYSALSPRCGSLDLYRSAARVGVPAWSWERYVVARMNGVCSGGLVGYTLSPGDSVDAPVVAHPVAFVLGDSLPTAQYFARVSFYLETRAGVIGQRAALDAGSVELRRP